MGLVGKPATDFPEYIKDNMFRLPGYDTLQQIRISNFKEKFLICKSFPASAAIWRSRCVVSTHACETLEMFHQASRKAFHAGLDLHGPVLSPSIPCCMRLPLQ